MRAHLERRLSPKQDQYDKSKFNSCRHKEDQEWEDYTAELQVLGYGAFASSGYTDEQLEGRILDHYVSTMGGNLGRELRLRIPQNLAEAVAITKKKASGLQKDYKKSVGIIIRNRKHNWLPDFQLESTTFLPGIQVVCVLDYFRSSRFRVRV